MMMGGAAMQGFALSLGLIVALGPQNAFVIRQGLMRAHVFAVCLFCSIADISLILIGTLGVGGALASRDGLHLPMTLAAAGFLLAYGMIRFRASMRPVGLEVGAATSDPLGRTIAAGMAFTFLNPHVYLDTLVLIGGYALRFEASERLAFAAGASTASVLFFFTLGYGSSRLAPVLSTAEAWRWIDRGIGAMMLLFAAGLLWPLL